MDDKDEQMNSLRRDIEVLSAQIDTDKQELSNQRNINQQLNGKIDEQRLYIKQLVTQNNELSYNS